ncbi:flagellar protein FlaG [Alteromonas antoniana]|uniref:flagellar protein FlaG n=1 Tax=Alteromonas antoniana TaxID=2803813 RepID=UPI001C464C0F
MEIANTQIGQNFAVTAVDKVPVRVDSPRPVESSNDSTDLSVENARAKDLQVERENADNLNREGQAEDIELAVQEVQAFLQVQNRNLAFSVDEDTQRSVVTVKDSESGDVIRQIPSEEVLKLAERIKSLQEDIGSSVGVLVNNKV